MHIDHMHAAVHGSVTYGCQRNRNLCKMHKLLGYVIGRHYNFRNSDVSLPRAPSGLGGGDV